jgi:hypothetical protein
MTRNDWHTKQIKLYKYILINHNYWPTSAINYLRNRSTNHVQVSKPQKWIQHFQNQRPFLSTYGHGNTSTHIIYILLWLLIVMSNMRLELYILMTYDYLQSRNVTTSFTPSAFGWDDGSMKRDLMWMWIHTSTNKHINTLTQICSARNP